AGAFFRKSDSCFFVPEDRTMKCGPGSFAVAAVVLALLGGPVQAASHSDAPPIKQDPQANPPPVYPFIRPQTHHPPLPCPAARPPGRGLPPPPSRAPPPHHPHPPPPPPGPAPHRLYFPLLHSPPAGPPPPQERQHHSLLRPRPGQQ